MREFILSMLAVVRVFCQSRSETAIEVLALRQQVAVLKRKRPRPVLNSWDRLFWTKLSAPLVTLERRARDREARDGHQLAPCRFPAVLALAVPPARRPTEGQR